MADLAEVMEGMKETSDFFASKLEPDGDWQPMIVIVKDDEFHIMAFRMPANGWERELLFSTVIPNAIHEKFPDPDILVMLVSTWYTEDGWEPGDPLPAEREDRKEALVLQGISKKEEFSAMAEIIRGESHPELRWIKELEESKMEGRLVGCLRRAVWT